MKLVYFYSIFNKINNGSTLALVRQSQIKRFQVGLKHISSQSGRKIKKFCLNSLC